MTCHYLYIIRLHYSLDKLRWFFDKIIFTIPPPPFLCKNLISPWDFASRFFEINRPKPRPCFLALLFFIYGSPRKGKISDAKPGPSSATSIMIYSFSLIKLMSICDFANLKALSTTLVIE